MIEDNSLMPHKSSETDRALFYDYFKWITTLSLVSIGGVFSLITQSDFVFRPVDLMIVLICLAIAAATGLSGVDSQISLSSDAAKLAKRSRTLKSVAMFALGAGAGYFIVMFSDKLYA